MSTPLTQALLVLGIFVAELYLLRGLGDRVSGRLLSGVVAGPVGRKLLIYPLIAPGVILHELGHALAAIVSGAGIRRFVPFWPTLSEDGGVLLGYVQPRWVPRLPGGQALIAFAPLLLPPLGLYVLAPLLIEGLDAFAAPQAVFAALWHDLSAAGALLWGFLFASMCLSNFPSDQDFRSLGSSRYPFLALLLGTPLAVAVLAPDSLETVLSPYKALALFLAPSVAVCLFAALLLEAHARRH